MGADDPAAALGHLALAIVASDCSRDFDFDHHANYMEFGTHLTLLAHGVLGALHYYSGTIGIDVAKPYAISLTAAKFLPVACMMAEVWHVPDRTRSLLHLASGVIPFAMALATKEDPNIVRLVAGVNLIAFAHFAYKLRSENGYIAAGCGAIAYFVGPGAPQKAVMPVALAAMMHFAHRMVGYGGVSF